MKMKEANVTRSFLCTVVEITDGEKKDKQYYPCQRKEAVLGVLRNNGVNVTNIEETIVRYVCPESEFFKIAKPL